MKAVGRLWIVPTPLGNLGDLSPRAIEVMAAADAVLAEDTRMTGKLLRHAGVSKPLRAFHQHNEHKTLDRVVKQLLEGATLALCSDAGTPGISDPGFMLVRECVEAGVEVTCLPGPTAFVPALVASGLPCDRFIFEGFLPHKKGRQKRLGELASEERTLVFYESPHRIEKLLGEIRDRFSPDRRVVVAREISKLHEEFLRGTPGELLAHFEERPPKGEIVVVVAGA